MGTNNIVVALREEGWDIKEEGGKPVKWRGKEEAVRNTVIIRILYECQGEKGAGREGEEERGQWRGGWSLDFSMQEAIVKILKMRKRMANAALQTELVEILKNMFIPPKKMIKEQIEWLIEHKYMKRDETDRNKFIYLA